MDDTIEQRSYSGKETAETQNLQRGVSEPRLAVSQLETIRTRLIVAFITVAILPFLGISLVLGVSSTQSGRQDAINQLDTVMSYKETAIRNWVSAMKVDLGSALVGENTIRNIEQIIQASAQPTQTKTLEHANALEAIRTFLISRAAQSLYYEEFSVLNPEGVVILSTDKATEGQILSDSVLFRLGQQIPYVDPPSFSSTQNKTLMYASYPITNAAREVVGVLVGRARFTPLNDILNERMGLGRTGVTYLVGMNRALLAGLKPVEHGRSIQSAGVLAAFGGESIGSRPYENYLGELVLGSYRWIPDLQAVLMAEQAQIESLRPTYANLAVNASVAVASVLVALFIALLVTRSIAAPVTDLAETASLIASGERKLSAPADRRDEIGVLAKAFNSMTAQLNSLIEGLEQRVADRTRELELRSNLLEASVEIGRATTSILDPVLLLRQAVELIRDRFNLYYVGLFLVSSDREWAILQAGTGQAGQTMLARGHRLEIGSSSMIGWCIDNAQARIAQVASADAIRITAPELPETRSEGALPLRSRGQVIGAITIQSERPDAFDQASLTMLQSMADQLAVAIDNARLFAESQQALEAERRAYAAGTQIDWQGWLKSRRELSFRADKEGITPIERPWHSEMKDAYRQNRTIRHGEKLAIPIRVRGHVIGVIDTNRPAGDVQWTEDDVTLLEGVADQLGVALDSARLYAETQQRAEQERLVGEITGHMRQSLDVEAVLKTAVDEIYRALNLENLVIQLTPRSGAIDINPDALLETTPGMSISPDLSVTSERQSDLLDQSGGGDGHYRNNPDENPPSSVSENNP
jgi:GAF domain-containing protein/HAMP domain-containing protein